MKNPPIITIETLEQTDVKSGFLGIDRRKVRFHYPDNSTKEMTVDAILRTNNDAVAIVAHYEQNGTRFLYLRSCVRPPLAFRDYIRDSGRPEGPFTSNIFEVPAGLVDKEEFGEGGLIDAARRELHEEIGIDAPKADFKPLGPRSFSSVGMTAERIYYFEVEVDPNTIGVPLEDGSPLEHCGEVYAISLNEALIELEAGNILDSKTQISIMRLAKKYIGS